MESKKVKKIKKGSVYGELTVISESYEREVKISKIGNKTIRALWSCRCSCGQEIKRSTTDLKTKDRVNMCTKCAYKARPQSKLKYSNEERMYNLSIVSRCEKSKGRIKNKLSLEDYIEISSKDCNYCGEEPREITYLYKEKGIETKSSKFNGIDRLDSSLHYSIENCVSCCKTCNTMKASMRVEDFINHIRRINNKNKNKENEENP